MHQLFEVLYLRRYTGITEDLASALSKHERSSKKEESRT
jgi:hypothetical protein